MSSIGKVKNIPWEIVRSEFVQSEGPITIQELAKKHVIHPATVYQRCYREKWHDLRNDFWRDVTEQARKQLSDEFAASKVRRARAVSRSIDRWLERLEDKDEVAVNELLQLLRLEKELLEVEDKNDKSETFEVHVAAIRARIGRVNDSLRDVVDSGLRRLGFEATPAGSEGP
jgi:predicted  nucleic acid-binding Zn-ribbon protein